MQQLTVKELLQLCMQEYKKGNGNKFIVISDDNEGNSYHGLFFGFTQINEEEKKYFPIYDTKEKDINNLLILG